MKIKHKVVKEFQYLSEDKKIFVLKAGTIIEEYNYKAKSETIAIDSAIIDNNPEFFEIVDWKADLLAYIKANKLPTPAVLAKKLIPFFEDIVASSASQAAPAAVDDSLTKELDRKEADLDSRDKSIKEKEDEIEIRLNRLDKRESEYKEDMKSLDEREDSIREKSRQLVEKSLDLDDKTRDLNEKERNIDLSALESSKEIDAKYAKLQKKIDLDLKALLKKEKEFEENSKAFLKRENELSSKEEELLEKSKKNEDILDCLEEIDDRIFEINDKVNLLNDFNTRPFTKDYLVSIYLDLKEQISSIRETIKNAK